MMRAEISIEQFDKWMLEEPDLSSASEIAELGFKQLNDMLLYKWVPEYRDWVVRDFSDRDDARILEYDKVRDRSVVQQLDVHAYLNAVQTRLSTLPDLQFLERCASAYRDVIIQDLITVAFAVERWGQSLLQNTPGYTVRHLNIGTVGIPLHDYLIREVGNYNTLGRFALRSTSLVTGVWVPQMGCGLENTRSVIRV
ncbi:MAG: hypothetical protein IPL77_07175 [Flavobacteriales bacterium]|nr:hypothetical protein [Flavobacteriales bacterium]